MTRERPTFRDYTVVRRMPDDNREVYLAVKGDGVKSEYVLVVVEVPEGDVAAFNEDVRRARNLEHEAVVPIVESFPLDDGRHVVVSESVEGMTLHRLMRYLEEQGERLSDGAVFHLGLTIMDALSSAHGRRVQGKPEPIVHGQLGPHQILITWDGDVRLLGLGLNPVFRRIQPPPWLEAYQAPEMRDREKAAVTPRANTFTAALIMWSLLTGRAVEADTEIESLKTARPDLKAAVAHPLDRALDDRPIKRVSSKSVVMALRRIVETADREELRWALEVCRVRCTVAEEFFPTASFPPSHSDRAPDSVPPMFEDDEDEDLETSEYSAQQLLEQARLVGPLPWEHDKEGSSEGGSGRPRPTKRAPRRTKTEKSVSAKNPSDGSATLPAAGSEPAPQSEPGRVPVLGYPAQAYPPPPPPPPGMTHPAYTPPGSERAPSSQYPGQRFQTNHGSQPPPGSYPPSQPAPGSHYPYPHYAPYGYAPMHPSVPPESMRMSMPPESAPKHRWTVAIAVTAVMSFALGVLIASGGIEIRFHGFGGPEQTAAAAPEPPPPAPAAAPIAEPSEPAVAEKEAPAQPVTTAAEDEDPASEEASEDAEEDAEVAEEEEPEETDEETAATGTISAASLPPERGVLKVISPFEDAHVYIGGHMMGPVGVDLEVNCGMKFVRLGTSPLGVWFGQGQPVNIQCQNYTVVTIDKRRPDNTFRPRRTKKRGQFF